MKQVERQFDFEQAIKRKEPLSLEVKARLTGYLGFVLRGFYFNEDYHREMEKTYPLEKLMVINHMGTDYREILNIVYQTTDEQKVDEQFYPLMNKFIEMFHANELHKPVEKSIILELIFTESNVTWNKENQRWEQTHILIHKYGIFDSITFHKFPNALCRSVKKYLSDTYPESVPDIQDIEADDSIEHGDKYKIWFKQFNHNLNAWSMKQYKNNQLDKRILNVPFILDVVLNYGIVYQTLPQNLMRKNYFVWNDNIDEKLSRKLYESETPLRYILNLPYPITQLILLGDLIGYLCGGDEAVDIESVKRLSQHLTMMREIEGNNRKGYRFLSDLTKATIDNDLDQLRKLTDMGKLMTMAF